MNPAIPIAVAAAAALTAIAYFAPVSMPHPEPRPIEILAPMRIVLPDYSHHAPPPVYHDEFESPPTAFVPHMSDPGGH